jgi:hypothetical protein
MIKLTFFRLSALLFTSLAGAAEGVTPDEAVRRAQARVLKEIRAGNRDTTKLMKIMAPAIKAHNNELESQARAKADEEIRLRNEALAKEKATSPGKGANRPGGKTAQPSALSNSLNGASRYGGSAGEAPIMDPGLVPKEMTFEKSAAKTPVVSGTQATMPPMPETAASPDAASGAGGVDEIQFEVQPKPSTAPKPGIAPKRR